MMLKINDRLRREDKGFTLIELMVVVLIIAILIAIAIPTFLGARRRAQDRAAQSSDRNALTGAKAIFTDNEDYVDAVDAAGAPTTELIQGEPSLTFVAKGVDSTDANTVSVFSEQVGTPAPTKYNRFVAATLSDSGVCWYVQDIVGPTGTANTGTTWSRDDDGVGTGNCNAAGAPAFGTGEVAGGWFPSPGDAQTP